MKLDPFPPDVDFSFVGLHEPVEDLHQRRFTSAVFAENGVDLTCPHLEVDLVIGDDPWESLGDSPRFQDRVAALPE